MKWESTPKVKGNVQDKSIVTESCTTVSSHLGHVAPSSRRQKHGIDTSSHSMAGFSHSEAASSQVGGHKRGRASGVSGHTGAGKAKGVGHPASHEGKTIACHCVGAHRCATLRQKVGILQPNAAQEESCSISILTRLRWTYSSIMANFPMLRSPHEAAGSRSVLLITA